MVSVTNTGAAEKGAVKKGMAEKSVAVKGAVIKGMAAKSFGGIVSGSGLHKKFWRDLRFAKGQITSIILLSMLGVLVFSGLDGAWRNIELSIESYFEEQKLADFWVMVPLADRKTERRLARLEGVKEVQRRLSWEAETTLPGDPKLMLHAVRGDIRVNVPRIIRGSRLWSNDRKGCLLDEKFAEANGLRPGDSLTLKIGANRFSFIVRGLVISPEYVFTAEDIIPEPEAYGYIYADISAFSRILPWLPENEICVLAAEDTAAGALKRAIESELPGAFVRDRKAHRSTGMIRGEVSQFRDLSGIFPIMFFAVSALIVLTTMRRIVENQRMQMGVLKALGYGRVSMLRHYLSFGFYPSLLGSSAGLLIGRYTLPRFLWNVIADLYVLPEMKTAGLSAATLTVCILSILLTCIICFAACRRNISETSAALLRPKVPKAGSRIFLERIPQLWSSFSFNTKMIQRNLFRNKMRTAMALMGVLSCTALIITALGIMDSVNKLIGIYYEDTLRYDLRAELDGTARSADKYRKRLDAGVTEGIMEMVINIKSAEAGNAFLNRNSGSCSGPDFDELAGDSRTVLLTVFEDSQQLISLGGELDDGEAVMTEKLAEVMGLEAGDILFLKLPGGERAEKLIIGKLVQVQIGQGVYIPEKNWEDLERGTFIPTALLVRDPGHDCIEYLERLDEVTDIKWLSSLKEKTVAGMRSISSVSVLMAGFALVLAFVVLYNMGILNFIERTREFATLKVLGYHRRETKSLIIRENGLISVIGILLGVYPGIWLTELVMLSSEPDDMVFAPAVEPVSIIVACTVTLVFSLMIQRMLTRKVRTIDMVEALKSVE